jgi:radical SAM protein with 4Fe4S-binding SPASM domain
MKEHPMDFPRSISFTITNTCNLRCWMCGQWSEEGYIKNDTTKLRHQMELADWLRLVDELAEHDIQSVLLRGGEPFLFPGIIELIQHLNDRGISVSIDTNGTMLESFAEQIAPLERLHLTISVDGPEEIHDRLRGAPGTFDRLRRGIARIRELQQGMPHQTSLSLNFTICPPTVPGLGAMPDVARSLGVKVMAIVPYYYFPQSVGERYTQELAEHFSCPAFSWQGFHHETSGVDFAEFQQQYRQYKANLVEVYDFPYMPFSEEQYRGWFADAVTPVMPLHCTNVEKLIDIQPNGDANFCVDFVDYSFGNVRHATIAEVWNSEQAERFRVYRRQTPLAVCYRCGARYMSEM